MASTTTIKHLQRVKTWALKYDLKEEIEILINNGFENLQSLSLITESDLDSMGFTKIGTKKKIIAAVSEINCKIAKLRNMGGSLAEIHNIAYAESDESSISPSPTTDIPKADPTGDELLEYFEIRRAIIADMTQICQIFNYYCKNQPEITGDEDGKPENYFIEQFKEQDERHPILVQVLTKALYKYPIGTIIGYVLIQKFSNRTGTNNVVEFSIYVHHDFKSKGLGMGLVVVSSKFCLEHGFEKMINRIDSGNVASTKLHEKLGFTKIAVIPGVATIKGKKYDLALYQKDILKDKEKDVIMINQILPAIHQSVV